MIYRFIFVNKIKLTVLTLKNFMKLKFFYLIIEMSIHDIFAPSISVKVSTKRLSCDYNHLLHVWLTITKTIWYAMAGHVTKSKSYSFTPFYIRQYHQLIVVQPIKLGKTTKIFHSKKIFSLRRTPPVSHHRRMGQIYSSRFNSVNVCHLTVQLLKYSIFDWAESSNFDAENQWVEL